MRHVVMAALAASIVVLAGCTQSAPPEQQAAQPAAGETAAPPAAAPAPAEPETFDVPPVLMVETVKGSFEIETYPVEAPKTVAHIVALARRNFYNGQRVHRVVDGFVVQFGDPQSRDMTKRDRWGTSGSGNPIGVGEFSPKRTHVTGAVAIATPGGDAALGDSQMYIALAPAHQLDNQYTVFGKVTSGMDVVRKLEETDVIRRVTVKVDAPATE